MELSYRDVIEILGIIEDSRVRELHIEIGELKVHVVRRLDAEVVEHGPIGVASTSASATSTPPTPQSTIRTRTAAPDREGLVPVKAPTIGTFYRAPAPGARPFVAPGDSVGAGDALCLIEVMKLMTTVTAPVAGEVAEICVENEKMVGFGDVVMWLRPGNGPAPDLAPSDR